MFTRPPRVARTQLCPGPYVEPLSDVRTKLEEFFNILPTGILAHPVGGRQRVDRGSGGSGAMPLEK